MNTRIDPVGDAPAPDLPPLADERVDQMERALFSSIAADRQARRARRGRWWLGGAAAAAVILVAAIIAPSVTGLVTGASTNEAAIAPAWDGAGLTDSAVTDGFGAEEMSGGDAGGESFSGTGAAMSDARDGLVDLNTAAPDGREIIATASATVVVEDVADGAQTIADAATARDGYVESMSVGSSGVPMSIDTGGGYDMSMPYPYPQDGAWVTVRVPADELEGMLRELAAVGEVTSSTVDRTDVTDQAVDLRARIEAAEASVARLLDLLAEATDVSDLIAAESALSERQALLESYQQQLEYLESQVAMSTLRVSLVAEQDPVEADPAGFTDGLAAGWNGLVAALNGLVIALGFLLPWLVIVSLAATIVWALVRAARSRRAARESAPARTVRTDVDAESGDAP